MVLGMDKLSIKLVDGTSTYIEVAEGMVNAALEDFLQRKGAFAGEWIMVGAMDSGTARFVRYEQIAEVSAKLN